MKNNMGFIDYTQIFKSQTFKFYFLCAAVYGLNLLFTRSFLLGSGFWVIGEIIFLSLVVALYSAFLYQKFARFNRLDEEFVRKFLNDKKFKLKFLLKSFCIDVFQFCFDCVLFNVILLLYQLKLPIYERWGALVIIFCGITFALAKYSLSGGGNFLFYIIFDYKHKQHNQVFLPVLFGLSLITTLAIAGFVCVYFSFCGICGVSLCFVLLSIVFTFIYIFDTFKVPLLLRILAQILLLIFCFFGYFMSFIVAALNAYDFMTRWNYPIYINSKYSEEVYNHFPRYIPSNAKNVSIDFLHGRDGSDLVVRFDTPDRDKLLAKYRSQFPEEICPKTADGMELAHTYGIYFGIEIYNAEKVYLKKCTDGKCTSRGIGITGKDRIYFFYEIN